MADDSNTLPDGCVGEHSPTLSTCGVRPVEPPWEADAMRSATIEPDSGSVRFPSKPPSADPQISAACGCDWPGEGAIPHRSWCASNALFTAETLVSVPLDPDAARELSRAARMAATWRDNRDRLIREAHRDGAGLREIARLVGLTHRAVSKIVAKGDSDDATE